MIRSMKVSEKLLTKTEIDRTERSSNMQWQKLMSSLRRVICSLSERSRLKGQSSVIFPIFHSTHSLPVISMLVLKVANTHAVKNIKY
jgi:hypothetical protein